MVARIAIVQGHPDPAGGRLCHRLADAYATGALEAGREVRRIEIAHLGLDFLRSQDEFKTGKPPPGVAEAQETLAWADHWLIVYPLWLGDVPALFKCFLEQAMRPGFAFRYLDDVRTETLLGGRSAHVAVTMGMPALAYRWYYGAHSLRSLERNILAFVGVKPVRRTLVGMVGAMTPERAARLVARLAADGRAGR